MSTAPFPCPFVGPIIITGALGTVPSGFPSGASITSPAPLQVFQRTTITGSTFSKGSALVGISINLSNAVTTLEYRLRDNANPTGPALVDWTNCGNSLAPGVRTVNL